MEQRLPRDCAAPVAQRQTSLDWRVDVAHGLHRELGRHHRRRHLDRRRLHTVLSTRRRWPRWVLRGNTAPAAHFQQAKVSALDYCALSGNEERTFAAAARDYYALSGNEERTFAAAARDYCALSGNEERTFAAAARAIPLGTYRRRPRRRCTGPSVFLRSKSFKCAFCPVNVRYHYTKLYDFIVRVVASDPVPLHPTPCLSNILISYTCAFVTIKIV